MQSTNPSQLYPIQLTARNLLCLAPSHFETHTHFLLGPSFTSLATGRLLSDRMPDQASLRVVVRDLPQSKPHTQSRVMDGVKNKRIYNCILLNKAYDSSGTIFKPISAMVSL